ncbi:MAG: hypothetical protein QF577_08015 [Phycisphaerae bacterium]|nr:hypothetical protein [Phycisphaerae bacterium]
MERPAFAKSIVMLRAARNVRYANFVQPGMTLRCDIEAISIDDDSAKFKGMGLLAEGKAVSARLGLRCSNLADRHGYLASADTAIVEELKKRFDLIGGPAALQQAGK